MPDTNLETAPTPQVATSRIEAYTPIDTDVPHTTRPGEHTVVPARTVLAALATDQSTTQNTADTSVNSTQNGTRNEPETTQPKELLDPREYPLIAQGLKARTIQTLRQAQNVVDDPNMASSLQEALAAISELDISHVGNRSGLTNFISTLSNSTQNESIQQTITAISSSAQTLTSGDQTEQAIARTCANLHLISPTSISGVLGQVGQTFTQKAQEAVQQAARELYGQNRVLSPEREAMITSNILEPYLSRIQNKHILSPTELDDLVKFAETNTLSDAKAIDQAEKNTSLLQLKNGLTQSVQNYQGYLSGSEQQTMWDGNATNELAESITQAIEVESDIEMDVELKTAEHQRRVQKVKTTGMLFAMLLSLLIYSSMPKSEQQ